MEQPLDLISEKDFNKAVRKWATDIRVKAVNNVQGSTDNDVRQWKKRKSSKLEDSLRSRVRKTDGVANRVGFEFERHGVFFHSGVGRGYIRVGSSVVRGSRVDSNKKLFGLFKKQGRTDKDIARMKRLNKSKGRFSRKPVNWIDKEIGGKLVALADIAQEYYGDEAMKNVLQQFGKIERPAKHKTILV